jgi:type IX secretion system PorP/SprF family membrane protein
MKKILVFAGMLILVNFSFAQDIHFSQFYKSQLYLNPSSSGVFTGDQRVVTNYRNQWPSISSVYETYLFSFDTKLFKNRFKDNYMGLGLVIFDDKAGEVKLGTMQASISLSYHVLINEHNYLSGGIQGGYAQHSIDNSALQWDNQYDGNDYDPNLASGEPSIMFSNFFYGDFGAGVLWNYFSSKENLYTNREFKANIGASVFHINKPEQSFSGNKDNLNPKFVLFGETSFGLGNTNMILLPGGIFVKQGPLTEAVFGSRIRYNLNDESRYTGFAKQSALSLGAYYRLEDAFIFIMEYEYSSFALGISYDVNTSSLKDATEGKGGIEISLRYINPNPFKRNLRFYR